ncbi:unnamed protein product [Rangifer tarandus platyrhynchus]|uniref:Uncharacterized protein n=1 Tax=Rangifer tarandus platyrhynchus TaxID=3082113 RepID=A0ACB1MJW9_RANTA
MFPGPCAADVQQEVFALAHAREGARANSEALAAVVAGDLTSGLLFTEGGVSGADGTPHLQTNGARTWRPALRPGGPTGCAPRRAEEGGRAPSEGRGRRTPALQTDSFPGSSLGGRGQDEPWAAAPSGGRSSPDSGPQTESEQSAAPGKDTQPALGMGTDGHEAHAREAEFRFESPFREGREVRLPSRAESRCPSFRLWLGEGLLPLRAPSRCGGGAGGAESGREKKPSRALQAQQGAALNASLH